MAHIDLAFYKGRKRLFSKLVSWWTRGPYSHCELVAGYDSRGRALCWSSSFLDHGVRDKLIELDPEHWDVFRMPISDEGLLDALSWFRRHRGEGYDVLGLFGFVWRLIDGEPRRWFCSEALAAALGFAEPWRFCPNTLHAALSRAVTPVLASSA